MNETDILNWIQTFACGFRHGLNANEYFIDWIDKDGHVRETPGCSLRDAVIGAKLQREEMYSKKCHKFTEENNAIRRQHESRIWTHNFTCYTASRRFEKCFI